jgi:hypothetical protein
LSPDAVESHAELITDLVIAGLQATGPVPKQTPGPVPKQRRSSP